jgi:hypothetical protein
MQEAAQQPILIKRMLSIADSSTLALEELMPKVTGSLTTTAGLAPKWIMPTESTRAQIRLFLLQPGPSRYNQSILATKTHG